GAHEDDLDRVNVFVGVGQNPADDVAGLGNDDIAFPGVEPVIKAIELIDDGFARPGADLTAETDDVLGWFGHFRYILAAPFPASDGGLDGRSRDGGGARIIRNAHDAALVRPARADGRSGRRG